MKFIKIYYIYIFPLLFVFPTVNLFAYIGINMPQLTLTNIGILTFIFVSFLYNRIDTKLIMLISLFAVMVLYSLSISVITLSDMAIKRGFIYLLYYTFIFLMFFAISTTAAFLHKKNKTVYLIKMIRHIGFFSLLFFYIITLHQVLYSTSPSLLSSDPTLGYRDFRNPLINGIHNYNVFRALGTFPEPSMYAGFIVTILPILLGKKKLINFIIILLVVISVVMTYSRIGILLLFCFLAIYFILSDKKTLLFLYAIGSFLLIFVIDVSIFNGVYLKDNIVRIFAMLDHIDVSIMTRVMTPIIFFQHSDTQLLFGYGLGSLIDILPTLDLDEGFLQFKVPTLNNFYLNFMAELGIVLFIVYMTIVTYFVSQLVKYNVHKLHKSKFIVFLLLLIYFFQIGHIIMFYMYFLLILLAIMLYYDLKNQKYAKTK